MRFTIQSRKHGAQSFWAPDAGGYVRQEVMPRHLGCTGHQICEGGGHMGQTLTCSGDVLSLERVARRWWRQHLRLRKEMGDE